MSERQAHTRPPVEVRLHLPAALAHDLDALAAAWRVTTDDLATLALRRLVNAARRHDGAPATSSGVPPARPGHRLPPERHTPTPGRRPSWGVHPDQRGDTTT